MKWLYIILGHFFLVLGVIGIFIPILPTTPFLLLTLYFYTRGSIRFKNWFEQTKIYNKHLRTFVETRSMTRRQKWSLMIFVDIIIIISCFIVDSWILRGMLILVLLLKHLYFHTQVKMIKSKKTLIRVNTPPS